jgi:hypothetical protein
VVFFETTDDAMRWDNSGEDAMGKKTYHMICQLSNVLEEEPHPFAHGLRVNGTLRPSDSGASRALPWIYLQEIECPKQMLGLALLGAQAALPQYIPHHFNNLLVRDKKL